MQIDVAIRADVARAQIDGLQSRIESALVAGMEDATSLLMRQVTTYPAARAGSRYVRTNTLRGSWHVIPPQVTPEAITSRVVSNENVTMTRSGIPYSRYVQDRDYQARVHQGRWTNTVQAVAERSEAQINALFDARIRSVIGG